MLCTRPQASQLKAPAPFSLGIGSPSSPRLRSPKSPPQMHRFSSKRESYSSTAFAQSGLCGQSHLPLNAGARCQPPQPPASASVTQLLAARKSTLSAAASAATPHTQPEPTHAINALPSQPCRWQLNCRPIPRGNCGVLDTAACETDEQGAGCER